MFGMVHNPPTCQYPQILTLFTMSQYIERRYIAHYLAYLTQVEQLHIIHTDELTILRHYYNCIVPLFTELPQAYQSQLPALAPLPPDLHKPTDVISLHLSHIQSNPSTDADVCFYTALCDLYKNFVFLTDFSNTRDSADIQSRYSRLVNVYGIAPHHGFSHLPATFLFTLDSKEDTPALIASLRARLNYPNQFQ